MPDDIRSARRSKPSVDAAISRTFRQLQFNPNALVAFSALLRVAHARSEFLRFAGDPHVECLANLARSNRHFIRSVADWPRGPGGFYDTLASLSQHLLCRYPVPRFLCAVWIGRNQLRDQTRRSWFIGVGSGLRFRTLGVPIRMTRRMESLFLNSPDHWSVEEAMRRAELRALGATAELCEAIVRTRLGTDLGDGDFWRQALMFLIRHQAALRIGDVGPLIDFFANARLHGGFCFKSRALQSALRLMHEWHEQLGKTPKLRSRWAASGRAPLHITTGEGQHAASWELVELTTGSELFREGQNMSHCVASYVTLCKYGTSQIWSLRRYVAGAPPRPVATIEVDPRRGAIVQARGKANRTPSATARKLIHTWASREGLAIDAVL